MPFVTSMIKIEPTPIWYNESMLTACIEVFLKVIVKLGSELGLKCPIFAQCDFLFKSGPLQNC